MENEIAVGGSDTSMPLNLKKRLGLVAHTIDLRGKRVLDAGCGAGEFVEGMCDAGAQAQGIEFVEDKVREWEGKHPGDPRVQQGDLAGLKFDDRTFDAVLLNEVLEHVPDDVLALKELFRVLKPGGTLMLFSPNRYHPFETHGVYSLKTGALIGMPKTFMLPWLPIAIGSRYVRYWSRNYWPMELANMVKAAGFHVRSLNYVWQTFENISGDSPGWVRRVAPVIRKVAKVAEKLPLIRRLAVSQLIVAVRP